MPFIDNGGGGGGLDEAEVQALIDASAYVPDGVIGVRQAADTPGYFPLLGGNYGNTAADNFTSTNQYLFAFAISREVTISHLSVECITLSAGRLRKMAIFDKDLNLVANSLVEFDLSSTGLKTVALAANVTLPAGRYYLGMVQNNTTAQIRCMTNAAHTFVIGQAQIGTNIHTGLSQWARNGTPGSYAAYPPATETLDTYGLGSEGFPWVIATLV